MASRYELLEHTADLRMAIYGATLAELFSNAAFAIFDVMVNLGRGAERERAEVRLVSDSLEELFLDWLRELLFRFSTTGFLPLRAQVLELEPAAPARLTAVLYGEPYEPGRHGLKLEIKTPTYHQFRLESVPGGYRAEVLFDV